MLFVTFSKTKRIIAIFVLTTMLRLLTVMRLFRKFAVLTTVDIMSSLKLVSVISDVVHVHYTCFSVTLLNSIKSYQKVGLYCIFSGKFSYDK